MELTTHGISLSRHLVQVSWKSFSIVKTKLSFRNLWDQKSYNKESDTTKHDYASINYYIIIHCQIGHVILVMFDYFTNKGNDLTLLMLQSQDLHDVSKNSNNSKVFYLPHNVHQWSQCPCTRMPVRYPLICKLHYFDKGFGARKYWWSSIWHPVKIFFKKHNIDYHTFDTNMTIQPEHVLLNKFCLYSPTIFILLEIVSTWKSGHDIKWLSFLTWQEKWKE